MPVYVLESTDNRASGIRGYIPQLLKLQYFWFIKSILKELYCTVLYCITEAPLDVLQVELCLIVGDLNIPIEQQFCLC